MKSSFPTLQLEYENGWWFRYDSDFTFHIYCTTIPVASNVSSLVILLSSASKYHSIVLQFLAGHVRMDRETGSWASVRPPATIS